MKTIKNIFKFSAAPMVVITAGTPIITLSSCSNVVDQMSDLMLDEFKALCKIPHSSDKILKDVPYEQGNCWNISCYLKKRFEQITGSAVNQDKYGNLWFDVEPNDSKFKDAPIIGLQAHMDMVFSYNPEKFNHVPDSKTTIIEVVEENINGKRTLHSKDYKTSIGADNGMGVAQILALLQTPSIKHGKLRIIITNEEENALQGANLLVTETAPKILQGVKYVVNIDGEEIGDICVASSGSVGSYYIKDYQYQLPNADLNGYKLTISNLKGGHSGVDIKSGRVNALKFMTDLLNALMKLPSTNPILPANVCLANLSTPGCTVYNAIPTSCEVRFASELTKSQIQSAFETLKTTYKNQSAPAGDKRGGKKYDPTELDEMNFTIDETVISRCLNGTDTKEILELQTSLYYGIVDWPTDEEMSKLVGKQTSANMGPAKIDVVSGDSVTYYCGSYSRSNVDSEIDRFLQENQDAWKDETTGVEHPKKYINDAKCYGWTLDDNQKLADMCIQGWKNAGVKEDKISKSRTHGAIECSWWKKAMKEYGLPDSECISYGPQITDCHKFTESVEIDTIKQCVNVTLYILSHANEL